MQKQLLFIIVLLVLGAFSLKAQDTLPAYRSKAFRSLDLNVGIGLTHPKLYPIPLTVVYQQNIKKGLSCILFSQAFAQFTGEKVLNARFLSLNWVEAVGIGGTIGWKWFNTGLFIVGGGRFYHSKLTLDNAAIFHEPTLVTNKLNPELGLLYKLKIGNRRLFFTSQIYVSLLPLGNFGSKLHTFSIGAGYRFKGKG